MKITIFYVGKSRSEYEDQVNEYKKKLNRFINLEELNIKHSSIEEESVSILNKIKSDDYLLLLDEEGGRLNSIEFANFWDERMNSSVRNVVVLIGGAYGVSAQLKERANYTLRLSDMVLPHELARLFIYEAIYRSFNILSDTPYHHL
jgi:23S rRNA (pseudouridine1915-N3)-methyltransferase